MNLEYRYSESTVKPETLEVFPTHVYLRKDIASETRTYNDNPPVTYWTYQEACIPRAEFDENVSQMLIAGQKSNEDNLMIIMESVADLYEARLV